MAVGKGSMDRASKALKDTRSKVTAETVVDDKEKEKTIKTSETKKTGTKKATTKKAAVGTRNIVAKDKEEMKAAVITATDPQVMELIEKEQIGKKQETEKEERVSNLICGIGDELPVYFL